MSLIIIEYRQIDELSKILNIGYQSVRTHCQVAFSQGLLDETVFYEYHSNRSIGILHYRYVAPPLNSVS